MSEFQEAHGENWAGVAPHTGLHLLAKAMESTGSTEPSRVGPVLAGLGLSALHGPVQMRRDDHQLQTGLWLSRWQPVKTAADVKPGNPGFAFAPVAFVPAERLAQPSTCSMQRL
jgi:branched-chain amino acid transport system substrate-binding protein